MVTIRQIAAAVGVSSATVSRVLNYDATLSISAKKRQAIIETAEALNYATPRARNRANGGTTPSIVPGAGKIALVHFLKPSEELTDPYYIGVRLGIESRCQQLKTEVVKVYHSDEMPSPTILQGASGVIAVGHHTEAEVDWLRMHSRNLVFADFSPPSDSDDSVESDVYLATRKLLTALTGMGYRRIGFIGWVEMGSGVPEFYGEKRCKTYMSWMREAGLFDPDLMIIEPFSQESGYMMAKALLSRKTTPDCLVTCNDNMAIGAYRAIHELGLRIPDDIAVASFNDIPVAQFLAPPLSTVKIPAELIGETAVDLLLERIAGRDLGKKVTLATEIVWRDSCRKPE